MDRRRSASYASIWGKKIQEYNCSGCVHTMTPKLSNCARNDQIDAGSNNDRDISIFNLFISDGNLIRIFITHIQWAISKWGWRQKTHMPRDISPTYKNVIPRTHFKGYTWLTLIFTNITLQLAQSVGGVVWMQPRVWCLLTDSLSNQLAIDRRSFHWEIDIWTIDRPIDGIPSARSINAPMAK